MNIGILITVRTGSSRLPNKALKEVMGKPIISYLVSRMNKVNHEYAKIIICTTTLEEDAVLDDIAIKCGALCFHGDEDNIIRRHLQCANECNLDFIVNVDGDDILCDPEYVKLITQYASESNDFDVIKTIGLPFGTNSIGYKRIVLETILENIDQLTIDTGWGRLISDPSTFSIREIHGKDTESCDCRLTLDYEEDFVLFKTILEKLFVDDRYISQRSIIEYIRSDPSIIKINQHVNEKYWENFNSKRILIEDRMEKNGE